MELQIERLKQLESQIGYSTQFASSAINEYTLDEYMTQSSIILKRLEALTSAFIKEQLSPCTDEEIIHKIETSPASIQELGLVAEGCYPPNCILEVNPPGNAIVCEASTRKNLRLVARDYQDELVEQGGEAVQAQIIEVTDTESIEETDTESIEVTDSCTSPVDVRDNDDGTYQIGFEVPDAGQYKLSVTIRNQKVRGSPFEVVVNAKKKAAQSVLARHVSAGYVPARRGPASSYSGGYTSYSGSYSSGSCKPYSMY